MYNDILKLGPVMIHGYGLAIAIGIFVAELVGEARAKKRKLNPDEIFNLTCLCAAFGFFCAKLLFCIVEWKNFIQNPVSVLKMNGFVVYGGIVGGIFIAYIWCKFRKLAFWEYFDVVLPSVAVAQGFGRIGCFLAGCCYGRETDSAIGIAFSNSQYAPNDVKLIPTQLISSAGMFLIAAILFWYARKPRKTASVGAIYLILYSIGRFLIEFFRNDYRGAIGVLSTSQFISLFIVIIGVVILAFSLKNGKVRDWTKIDDDEKDMEMKNE